MSVYPKPTYSILNRYGRRNLYYKMMRLIRGFNHTYKPRIHFGDFIKIECEVIIRNGLMIQKGRNRFVSMGIKSPFVQHLGNVLISTGSIAGGISCDWQTSATHSRMRVGTDTATPTTEGMTDLIASVATDRNSANTCISRVGAGIYRVAWSATWNAGVLGAITVGEMGLWLRSLTVLADASFPVTNYTASTPTSLQFAARLSSASGDFTAFTVDVAYPLTIEWRLTFTF